MPDLSLCDEYPTSLPAEQLASLVSSVTEWVSIENVSGCDLVNILDSVKSKQLTIFSQSLGREETQALVRAMESRVEKVRLHAEVKLDIIVLMEYSGRGKCGEVEGFNYTENFSSIGYRYSEALRTWARSRNWEVTYNIMHFTIKRI